MFKYLLQEVNKFASTEYKKILKNIGWLFFDKVFRMGMGLVVGAWVARYLGPSEFGTFNYLMATIGIFTPFAALGIESMVVKELVENPNRAGAILSTAITLRIIAGLLSLLVCIGVFFFLKHDDIEDFYVGCILAFILVGQAIVTVELYFQSQVESRIAVIAQSIAYISMSIVKVVIILMGGGLIAFATVTSFEMFLGAIFMLISFKKRTKQRLTFSIDKTLAKHLLVKSWPLIFSGFMIMIYMRIDQIMLGRMINDYEVGTYSAALKLSEIWYIIAGIVCNSFFPTIIEAKRQSQEIYFRKIQKLFDVLFLISVSVAITISLLSPFIIDILYGDEFKDAAVILSIHIWTALFVYLGTASSNFFVIENLQIKTFTRTAMGAVLNIVLNLILIPKFMAIGAAVATLISQFFSSYVFDLLSRKTYVLFRMKTRSFLMVSFIQEISKRISR